MTGIFQDLEMVFQGMCSWISFLPRITFSNVTEIIILTILVYYALLWIKSTKAWYLLRGIAMIMAFAVAAAIFHWDTILWILGRTGGIAVTALVIIFQPELRKALELGVDLLQGYCLARPAAIPPPLSKEAADIIHRMKRC